MKDRIVRTLFFLGFSIITGLIVGFIDVFFSKGLILAANLRVEYFNKLIIFLPFVGVSMIFLYKLNLLRYIEYDNIIVLKSSILTLEESMYYKSDYLEILKIVREYKVEVFNNIDINDLNREREIKNFEVGDVMKLFYACKTKKASYITEDKNNLFKDKYPTYSSLYLVIKQAIRKKNFLEEVNNFSPDAKRIIFNMLSEHTKLTI